MGREIHQFENQPPVAMPQFVDENQRQQAVFEYADSIIEQIKSKVGTDLHFDPYDMGGYFDFSDNIARKLHVLSGESENQDVYSDDYRSALNHFIGRVLGYFDAKKDEKEMDKFAFMVDKYLFGTDLLTRGLKASDCLRLAARSTRNYAVQGSLGASLMGELKSSITEGYLDIDKIKSDFADCSVPEKIDRLQVYEFVAADAGAMEWSSGGEARIKAFLDQAQESEKSAFVKYYIEVVKDRLEQEESRPTRAVVVFDGDPANARLIDYLSKEDNEEADSIRHKVFSNISFRKGRKMLRTADDALSVFDHANRAIYFGRIKKVDLEQAGSKAPISDLAETCRILSGSDDYRKIDFENLFKICNERFFAPLNGFDQGSAEHIDFLGKVCPLLSPEQWDMYLNSEKILQELLRRNYEGRESRSADMYREINKRYAEFAEYLYDHMADFPLENNKNISFMIDNFCQVYKEGDFDKAISAANRLMVMCEMFGGDDFKNNSLYKKYEELIAARDGAYKAFEKSEDELAENIVADNQSLIAEYDKAQALIREHRDEIISALKDELGAIFEKEKSKAAEVEFLPFKTFIEKSGLYFSAGSEEETSLLFQHLYRPAMRRKIEEKIGINLKSIPVQYQIHLLNFLSAGDENQVEKVKQVLGEANGEESKLNRAKSFLSLEQDPGMWEVILSIGDKLRYGDDEIEAADRLFGEYARMVDTAESRAGEIKRMYNKTFFDKQVDENHDPSCIY